MEVQQSEDMTGRPPLVTLAEKVLEGQLGSELLLECWETTRNQAQNQHEEALAQIRDEPPGIRQQLQAELHCLQNSYDDYLRVIDSVKFYLKNFERAHLTRLIENLPLAGARLHFDLMRLQDALWIARGPTTLAGLNRILGCVHTQGADQALFQEIDQEADRLTDWLEEFAELVLPPLQPALHDFAQHYMTWLEEVPADLEQRSAWGEQGLALGMRYAANDISYLWRRYAQGPTEFSLLNLSLNSAWLLVQGFVTPALTRCCLEDAREHLVELRQALPEEAEQPLLGLVEELMSYFADLEDWIEHPDPEDLLTIRQGVTDVAKNLSGQFTSPGLDAHGPAAPMQCPVCGLNQSPATGRCQACGSRLQSQGFKDA